MAFVTTGWDVVVNMEDIGSDPTSRTYSLVPTITDIADVLAAKDTILTDLAAVSDCGIKGYNIVQRYEDDAYTPPSSVTSDVSTHAECSARLAGFVSKYATVDIPGPKQAIFVAATGPNNNVVNPTNAAVLAYVGLFGNGANIATVSDGEQFNAGALNLTGKRTHSRTKKG